MSKFCKECGSEIIEEKPFCGDCGARLDIEVMAEERKTAAEPKVSQPVKKKLKRPLITALIASAAVLVIGAGITLALTGEHLSKRVNDLFFSTYETPVLNMVEGIKTSNYEIYISAFIPSEQEEIDESRLDADLSKKEYMEQYLESIKDKYGKNVTISCIITDSRRLDQDELEALDHNLSFVLEEIPSEGYEVKTKLTLSGSKGENFNKGTFTSVKLKGKWYITMMPRAE